MSCGGTNGKRLGRKRLVPPEWTHLDRQTDRHIWRICSWHKNQQAMQVGGKTDEMGWGVYDACTDLSAIIATGPGRRAPSIAHTSLSRDRLFVIGHRTRFRVPIASGTVRWAIETPPQNHDRARTHVIGAGIVNHRRRLPRCANTCRRRRIEGKKVQRISGRGT